MIRIFSQHQLRPVDSLDGTWTYEFPRSGTVLDDTQSREVVALEVPGAWEADRLDRATYRGEALARRRFLMPEAGPALLLFAGVGHTAEVFVDGQAVGSHHNAFTAFRIGIPHLAAGEHDLAVRISNAYGELSGLHIANDYESYGGITRPVELHRPRREVFIRRADADPVRDDQGWRVPVTVDVDHLGHETEAVALVVRMAETETRIQIDVPPGGMRARVEIRLPPETPMWSPAQPHLHRLRVTLGDFDDWSDRIGLRTLSWDRRGIHLNGAFVRFLGVCRHEDHAEYGSALPVSAMRRDLQLIQALGANAVRTTHYPSDERFLDLCDELGILVWEENHARGQDLTAMRHPRFRSQALAVTKEMVDQHRNHPSIVIWGILNECASNTPEGREFYVEEIEAIRRRDTSRPVSYATDRQRGDLCLDLCDVPSWNLYPLWYQDVHPGSMVDQVIADNEEALDGRSIIVSEIGAGGIPGLRDPIRRTKWSEEGQADIVAAQLAGVLSHPRVAGVFIWQFCDVRISADPGSGWPLHRPGGINDKGLVDRWRRPKPAFAVVQAIFQAQRGD